MADIKPIITDVRQFKGLNSLDDPIAIDPGESPYILNMDITKSAAMICRFGYELVSTIPAATGATRGILPYYRVRDDNSAVDQSDDPNHAYSNTYTPPTSISEAAANKKSFTPTKTAILKVAVYVVAKGTGIWTLTLHDSSNNVLGSDSILNANLTNSAFNYFNVPYTWTGGTLHFHVTSTVADGTLKCNTSSDLSTCSFLETYSTKGDYLLIFHNDGHMYYVNNDNFTPQDGGSFGSDNGMVRGTTFNNYAIFGNGLSTNTPKKWNVQTLANLGTGTPRANIFSVFGKRLWTNDSTAPSRAHYSDADSEDTNLATNFESIDVDDGQSITGFMPNTDYLQVFKNFKIQAINFSFDNSYNVTTPRQQPIIASNVGSEAPGSVVSAYGYSYFINQDGVSSYGASPLRVNASLPFPLSLQIDPTIQSINWKYKDNINGVFYQNKYLLAVPTGNNAVNNMILVYNENIKRRFGFDNWTVYTGIPALQFAIFRDNNKKNQLYFCSHTEPKVYKFNTTFADDSQFGYPRIWRSKTFQYGEITNWKWLYLEGAKVQGAVMYVVFNTDGVETAPIEINDSNFRQTANGSGLMGSNYIGDAYLGGGSGGGSATPMYKWSKRIRIPDTNNLGNSFYFQLYNINPGEGWLLSRYRLTAIPKPEEATYSNVEN